MPGIKLAKEGFGVITGIMLFTIVLVAGAITTSYLPLQIMAFLSFIISLITVNFFRDPDRNIPAGKNNVISPADGKIVEIKDEYEGEYLKSNVTRLSIFMNIFDVHVNRVPITGKVGFFRYQKGSFKNAYKSSASEVNEQTIIGIENSNRKIVFKQIAGLIARRIVCHIREGNKVEHGERFGIIQFGSRVDLFLPGNIEIKVNINQKVKAGEDIIGVFKDEV